MNTQRARVPRPLLIIAAALAAVCVAALLYAVIRPRSAAVLPEISSEPGPLQGELSPPDHTSGGERSHIPAIVTIEGMVIDGESRVGVPGVTIGFKRGSDTVLTAANGSFSISGLSSQAGVQVTAIAPPGWKLEVDQIDIRPADVADAARRPVVFIARQVRLPSAIAQLVNSATLEVLPMFDVELIAANGGITRATSDEQGYVPIGAPRAVQSIQFVDTPGLALTWKRVPPVLIDWDNAAVSPAIAIKVPAGPTYLVDVSLPSGLRETDFTATLEGPSGGGASMTSDAHAPLRGGGDAWVRFGPLHPAPTGGPPWTLWLENASEGWRGSEAVSSIIGLYPAPVKIRLERMGVVSGRVVSASGDPLSGAAAFLRRVGVAETVNEIFSPVSSAGQFSFRRVLPGNYIVGAVCTGFGNGEQNLTVTPAEEHTVELRLQSKASVGSVSGELRSATGSYTLPVTITLQSEAGSLPVLQTAEWRSVDGQKVAPFKFENIPVGKYVLSIFPGGGFPWDRQELRCHCPSSDALFTCRDDVTLIPVVVHVFDAESGSELPSMWSYHEIAIDGVRVGAGSVGPQRSGSALLSIVPSRTHVTWIVGAPGYVPAYGDESSFLLSESNSNLFMMNVRLVRGWGMEIAVKDSTRGGAGIPEVMVFLDDKSYGATRADGTIRLQATTAPRVIRLKHNDLSIVAGDVNPDGSLGSTFVVRGNVWMGTPR